MPEPPSSIKRQAIRAVQLFALWTVVVILFALQWYSHDLLKGNTVYLAPFLRWSMEQWYTWLILSPLVLWLAAKHPINPRRAIHSVALHLAASLVVAFLAICIQALAAHFFEAETQTIPGYIMFFLSKDLAINIGTYWTITALAQTVHFYRESSNRQLRETQLERQLAQTQLQVLQMQLHPHFLFNTLHAIGTLMREDPDAAEEMLLDLSSLLRIFLEQNSSQRISLRRELALVDHYLNIQSVRFRDRLAIRSLIAPDTQDCSVPALILQPIVENAIVHGVAKNPGDDVIEIRSWRGQTGLEIEISNSNSVLTDGIGPDGAGWGIGLSNTEQRLTQIYNGSATLSIQARSPGGVVCRIGLPFEISMPESPET